MAKSKGQKSQAAKPGSSTDDVFAQTIPESFIDQYINNPGAFVVPSASARAAAMQLVEKTYDAGNYLDKFGLFDDWKSVVDSGFETSSQLWELINIRNEPVLKYSIDTMKQLSALVESVNIGSDSESDEDQTMVSLDEEGLSDGSEDEEEAGGMEDESEEDEGAEVGAGFGLESGSDAEAESESESDNGSDLEYEDDDDEAPVNARRTVLDDEFFSLAEVEKFADDAEEEDMRDRAILAGDYPQPRPGEEDEEFSSSEEDEDDIDFFQDIDDDDDDEDDDMGSGEKGKRADEFKYSDFYKAPKGSKRAKAKASREQHAKRVKFDPNAADSQDEESSDEEQVPSTRKSNLFDDDDGDEGSDGGSGENKSEFEKRQEKLQGLINKLEDEAVEKKDWVMTGEIGSNERPKNSLLGEDLDFEYTQKPAPVITQDTTQTLEDIIKRRILNEEWDDVERKKDIQQKPFRPSEFIELDDKKSKKSLAEVYEDQYVAAKAGDDYVPENDAKVADAHKEVDSQFRNLFAQLDALSNFHFAPRPVTADIEIRTSAPALQMEEKLPVTMTTAEQLAPEEIYEKNQGRNGRTGDLMGETELTREERKRRRQRKKEVNKKKNAEIAAKKASSAKTAPAAAITNKKATKQGAKPKA
ncbi:U3 snoRNP protein [Coemansia sp. IMI 203386]|nr:U3 snoRNP protein [Coemansia sp. IMI 203386]